MEITPLEFVSKEFKELGHMSHKDWLRKMQEYAILQNSKVNLDAVLEIAHKQDDRYFALSAAISALYLKDNSDYETALCTVVKNLANLNWKDLTPATIKYIYFLLNPND